MIEPSKEFSWNMTIGQKIKKLIIARNVKFLENSTKNVKEKNRRIRTFLHDNKYYFETEISNSYNTPSEPEETTPKLKRSNKWRGGGGEVPPDR